MSTVEILSLLLIATLGHVMAGIWYAAYKGNWSICDRRIYDVPIQDKQLRRELKNSLHTPSMPSFSPASCTLDFSPTGLG